LTRLAWTTVVLFRYDQTMRKHIDVGIHVVREVVQLGGFEVSHVASELNRADFLTKVLPVELLSRASAMVGVRRKPSRGVLRFWVAKWLCHLLRICVTCQDISVVIVVVTAAAVADR
jgi:hypothetical protein